MQIAFITDLHIAPEGVNTLDIDVRRHFELVLADIADHRPDLLVVGGDLCFQEPDAVVYRFIKQRLMRQKSLISYWRAITIAPPQ